MNDLLLQLARGGGPITGAIATVTGGILGGAGFLSGSGLLLGAISGLGLVGITVPIAAIIARTTGQSLNEPALAGLAAAASRMGPAGAADAAASTVSAMSALPPSGGAASSGGTAATGSAAAPAVDETVTATETELLNSGRFPEYHLAKAKRYFATQNFKEAAYQASASLAHGDLAEAVELRKAALAAAK